MQLSREDIVLAAEAADLTEDDYRVHPSYQGWTGLTGAAVELDNPDKAYEFTVSLAVQLAENGRADDARNLGRLTLTNPMRFGIVVYWPRVEITD